MTANRTVLFVGAGLSADAAALADKNGVDLKIIPPYPDESALLEKITLYRPVVLIVRSAKITREVMATGLPELRLVAKHGVGVDSIDVAAASELGLPVSFTAGANAQSVAEQALALLFTTGRRIPALDGSVRQGTWDKTSTGLELFGKTVGLVGFGTIARILASMASSLNMKVRVFDPYAPDDVDGTVVERVASVDELLASCDVISMHCPLTDATRNMIDDQAIARMRDGAILINTARGELVDEIALAAALKSGKLAGAGLDTLAQEPPRVEGPLWSAPNLVVTPHVGASTHEAKARVGTIVMQQAIDMIEGKRPEHSQLANARAFTPA
ncbi:hydroxyacid dehydrogenase [Novosphingobium sp. 11B]